MDMGQQELNRWIEKYPLLNNIIDLQPVVWQNPKMKKIGEMTLPIGLQDMVQAEELWQRFAPYLSAEFQDTSASGGIVESPLREISSMKERLSEFYDGEIA